VIHEVIPKDEAKAMVVERKDRKVKVLRDLFHGTIEEERPRWDVLWSIETSYQCQRPGPEAQESGFGLAIIPLRVSAHQDVIFVETKEEKRK